MRSAVQLTLPNTTDNATDRGQCGELNADTLTRCTGRMVVHYETLHGQIGFPVWTCDSCRRVVVK